MARVKRKLCTRARFSTRQDEHVMHSRRVDASAASNVRPITFDESSYTSVRVACFYPTSQSYCASSSSCVCDMLPLPFHVDPRQDHKIEHMHDRVLDVEPRFVALDEVSELVGRYGLSYVGLKLQRSQITLQERWHSAGLPPPSPSGSSMCSCAPRGWRTSSPCATYVIHININQILRLSLSGLHSRLQKLLDVVCLSAVHQLRMPPAVPV